MATTKWIENQNASLVSSFQKDVEAAIVKAALDIQSEALASVFVPAGVGAPINTTQEVHNRRSQLCFRVLNNPSAYVSKFALGVAVTIDLYPTPDNASVLKATGDVAPTKNDISNAISAIWTSYALDCKA
jgi:hypothetical protein